MADNNDMELQESEPISVLVQSDDFSVDSQFWNALDEKNSTNKIQKLESIINTYKGDFEIFFKNYDSNKSCFEKMCSTPSMDSFIRDFFFVLEKSENFKDIKTKHFTKNNGLLKFASGSENFGCFWRLCQLIGLDNVNRVHAISLVDEKLKISKDAKKVSKLKHIIRSLIMSKKDLKTKEWNELFDINKKKYSENTVDVLVEFLPDVDLKESVRESFIKKIPKETDVILNLFKHIRNGNGDEESFVKDIKKIQSYTNERFSKFFRVNRKFYTLFQLACEKGLKKIVKILLTTKCDPNIKTKYNENSITLAFMNCHIEILKMLIFDKKVKYNKNILLGMLRNLINKKKLNEINMSKYNECLNVLKKDKRANFVFACTFFLKSAVKMNHEPSILCLLENGASINVIDENLDGIMRNEFVLENLSPKIFEAHLDDIMWIDRDSHSGYIELNLSFLKPIILKNYSESKHHNKLKIEKEQERNETDAEPNICDQEKDPLLKDVILNEINEISGEIVQLSGNDEVDRVGDDSKPITRSKLKSKNGHRRRKGNRARNKNANQKIILDLDETEQGYVEDLNEDSQIETEQEDSPDDLQIKSDSNIRRNSPYDKKISQSSNENNKNTSTKENIAKETKQVDQTDTMNEPDESVLSEMDVLLRISKIRRLRPFLKHPVMQTFLHFKWQKAKWIFWINFIVFSAFYLILLIHVFLDSPERGFNEVTILLTIALICLIGREVVQFYSYPLFYVKNHENWLEIFTFSITIFIICFWKSYYVRVYLSVFAIFMASFELIVLMAKFSIFSIYYTMLKSVIYNFFKFIGTFFIIFFCFALIFYKLFHEHEAKAEKPVEEKLNDISKDKEDYNFFLTLDRSVFKTLVMFTGELEASLINFDNFPYISHVMFVLFILIVTIVLYNFLNGLAISDIQAIKNDAELVSLIHRVEVLSYLENVVFGVRLVDNSNTKDFAGRSAEFFRLLFSKKYSYFIKTNPYFPRFAKKISLFPDISPERTMKIAINNTDKKNLNCLGSCSFSKKSTKRSSIAKNLPKLFNMDKEIVELVELKIKEIIENKMEQEQKMNLEARLEKIEEILKSLQLKSNVFDK